MSIWPSAWGAVVLTDWPPATSPTLRVMPFARSVKAWICTILCASSPIALMPCAKLPPECAALPAYLEAHEHAALAAGDDVAGRPAGLGIVHRTRRAAFALDHRARRRRGDLLVGGEQQLDRARRAAEFVECRGDKGVDDQTGLHVGDPRPIGPAALDGERPARHLALGKHRVAMPHQQDRLFVAARLGHQRMDGIAEHIMRLAPRLDAMRCKMLLESRAHRIDARPCRRSRNRYSRRRAADRSWIAFATRSIR